VRPAARRLPRGRRNARHEPGATVRSTSCSTPTSAPAPTDSPANSDASPSRDRRFATKRQTSPAVCRNLRERNAKSGKARTWFRAPPRAEIPCKSARFGFKRSTTEHLVSPVQVRVSSSEVRNPACWRDFFFLGASLFDGLVPSPGNRGVLSSIRAAKAQQMTDSRTSPTIRGEPCPGPVSLCVS
jgi:hypothetical protein